MIQDDGWLVTFTLIYTTLGLFPHHWLVGPTSNDAMGPWLEVCLQPGVSKTWVCSLVGHSAQQLSSLSTLMHQQQPSSTNNHHLTIASRYQLHSLHQPTILKPCHGQQPDHNDPQVHAPPCPTGSNRCHWERFCGRGWRIAWAPLGIMVAGMIKLGERSLEVDNSGDG